MHRVKQSRTSLAVWKWQETGSKDQQPRHSLKTAVIGLIIGFSVAGLLYYLGHQVMMTIVFIISGLIFACALFFPAAYRGIQTFFQKLSFWVGQGLTWILLVPFFYLCFTVGRLIQKVTGKDPMTRAWQREAHTYWVDHQPVTDKDQYKRQF